MHFVSSAEAVKEVYEIRGCQQTSPLAIAVAVVDQLLFIVICMLYIQTCVYICRERKASVYQGLLGSVVKVRLRLAKPDIEPPVFRQIGQTEPESMKKSIGIEQPLVSMASWWLLYFKAVVCSSLHSLYPFHVSSLLIEM